jgi:hypothetical protein
LENFRPPNDAGQGLLEREQRSDEDNARISEQSKAPDAACASGPDASSQGWHNGNFGEDQEQDAQPLRNAK